MAGRWDLRRLVICLVALVVQAVRIVQVRRVLGLRCLMVVLLLPIWPLAGVADPDTVVILRRWWLLCTRRLGATVVSMEDADRIGNHVASRVVRSR